MTKTPDGGFEHKWLQMVVVGAVGDMLVVGAAPAELLLCELAG